MKGQIYILIAILILAILVSLKLATKTIEPKQEILLYENFQNLKQEFIKTVDLSLLNESIEEEIAYDLDLFAVFSREIFKQKNSNEKVLYSFAYNGSAVAIGNFLSENINNVVITLQTGGISQVKTVPQISDGVHVIEYFTSFEGEFNITVTSDKKNFTYSGLRRMDSTSISEYFDIYLSYQNSYLNDMISVNRTISG